MKKISAVFDGLRFSEAVFCQAIELCAASGAHLTGVFLESFLYHSYDLQGVVGREGFLQAKVKKHLKQDKFNRDAAVARFVKGCLAANVYHKVHRDLGLTILEVAKESIFSDLLLVCTDDNFSTVKEEKPSMFIRDLLSQASCPLLFVPLKYQAIERVILLYDGRPRSVTAIKMCQHLFPWLAGRPVEVVSCVQDKKHEAEHRDPLMEEFITAHYPQATRVFLHGESKTAIKDHLSHSPKGTMVVMGANQRSMLSRVLNHTMAEMVLAKIELPIFIVNS